MKIFPLLLRSSLFVLAIVLIIGSMGCSGSSSTAPEEDPETSDRIESSKSRSSTIAEVCRTQRIVVPVAPSDLRAIVVQHPRAISKCMAVLEWCDNSNDEFCFIVEKKVGEMGNWTPIAELDPGCECYQDNHLSAGTVCWYRVQTRCPGGFSGYSNEVSVSIEGNDGVSQIVN